jgi:hypothetical protein
VGRRPNQRQRANARRSATREALTTLPPGLERKPRVPLAGFENLYEITRDGYVYSLRARRFIEHAFYDGALYIKLTVGGKSIPLDIQDAVRSSWESPARIVRPQPRIMRVDVPATTLLVYAWDNADARVAAAGAVREEVLDGHLGTEIAMIQSVEDVPLEWRDALPYMSPDAEASLDESDGREPTVAELLRRE